MAKSIFIIYRTRTNIRFYLYRGYQYNRIMMTSKSILFSILIVLYLKQFSSLLNQKHDNIKYDVSKLSIKLSNNGIGKFIISSIVPFFIATNAFLQPCISSGFNAIKSSEDQIIQLFEQNIPSVVYINTFAEGIDILSMNVLEVPLGTGSGFVWDNKGHIVTNYHVIRNSKSAKVSVTSLDGKSTKTYQAMVAGIDPDRDIAVLTLPQTTMTTVIDNNMNNDNLLTTTIQWKPIVKGCSSNLRVGQ